MRWVLLERLRKEVNKAFSVLERSLKIKNKCVPFFLLCFVKTACTGIYEEESYVFSMGDCSLMIPNNYKRVGGQKKHNGDDRFAFENQTTFLQIYESAEKYQAENENNLELLKEYNYLGLSLYHQKKPEFSLNFFIIKGELNVLVFSDSNKDRAFNEALKILQSCSSTRRT